MSILNKKEEKKYNQESPMNTETDKVLRHLYLAYKKTSKPIAPNSQQTLRSYIILTSPKGGTISFSCTTFLTVML